MYTIFITIAIIYFGLGMLSDNWSTTKKNNTSTSNGNDKMSILETDDINNTPEFYLKQIHFLYILIGALLIFAGGFLTNYFLLLGSH